jgi:hypothetical protein
MVNRDTLEMVHERMHDELVEATGPQVAAQSNSGNTVQKAQLGPGQTLCTDEGHVKQYNIAQNQGNKIYLLDFLKDSRNAADPAFKVRLSYRLSVQFTLT